jgi:hypothetical protein
VILDSKQKAKATDVELFTGIAIVLFTLIAAMHLVRLFWGWEITVNGAIIPIWASMFGFVIAGGLALMLWCEAHKCGMEKGGCRWLFGDNSHVFGTFLSGVGTLLFGFAAIWALFQTPTVLDNVLKIREQAQDIKTAVERVSQAVDLLSEQMRQNRSEKIIEGLGSNPTRENYEKALKPLLPSSPQAPDAPVIYLLKNNFDDTINKLQQTTNKQERINILQNSLGVSFENRSLKIDEGKTENKGQDQNRK